MSFSAHHLRTLSLTFKADFLRLDLYISMKVIFSRGGRENLKSFVRIIDDDGISMCAGRRIMRKTTQQQRLLLYACDDEKSWDILYICLRNGVARERGFGLHKTLRHETFIDSFRYLSRRVLALLAQWSPPVNGQQKPISRCPTVFLLLLLLLLYVHETYQIVFTCEYLHVRAFLYFLFRSGFCMRLYTDLALFRYKLRLYTSTFLFFIVPIFVTLTSSPRFYLEKS